MHIIYSLFLSFLLTFILGCGGGSTTTPEDPAVSIEEPVKSAAGIFTVGDDQNMLVGDTVSLTISRLDKDTTLDKFTWKEGETILGITEALDTNKLTPGKHEITVEVVDSQGHTYADTVTVTIKEPVAENSRPLAKDITLHTEEDSSITTALQGSDNEGDALSYLLISQPNHGTLRGSAARLVYTPDADYYGEDSFRYKTNDGTIDSNLATVSIMINAVNDAPTATNQNVTTNEDTALNITLSGTDTEGDSLTYTVVTFPSHGTFANGVYTPTANYFGSDSFTFKAHDGKADSASATVSIMIHSVNDAPIASSQSITLDEDTNRTITLAGTDTDAEGDSLTYAVVTSPSHGTYDGTTYTPTANYFGADSFTFKANDGKIDSASATVSIMINAVNDAPIAIDDFNSTNEDTNITFNLLSNDTDVDTNANLTLIDINNTVGFSFSGDGNLTFSPTNRYDYLSLAEEQNITITYTIADEHNATSEAIATITIRGLDDIVSVGTINTQESNLSSSDGNISGQITASDPDSTITYINNNNSNGFDINASGHYTFNPPTGLYDYLSEGEQAIITIPIMIGGEAYNIPITIIGQNDAPTVQNKSTTIPNDTNATFTLTAEDIDSTSFTYEILSADVNGTHTLVGNTFTYTPNAGLSGIVVYDYRAIDDFGATSNTATLTIDVNATNITPVAEDMTITLQEDSVKIIDLNASDANDNNLSFFTGTTTRDGNLTLTGGQASYQPTANFHGTDSFTYYVQDSLSTSNTATVTIHVNSVNDAPIANPDNNTTNEDTNITFNILANDSDVDTNATLTLIDVNATEGNFTFNPEGNLTFSPIGYFDTLSAGEEHNVTLYYTMQDEFNATADSNITITITGIDDAIMIAPINTSDANLSVADGNITGTITAYDPDTSVTYTDSNSSNGFDINASGHYRFSPPTGLYENLAEGEQTTITIPIMINHKPTDVNITIIGKNDAPVLSPITPRSVGEDDSPISGTITASDPEGGTLSFDAPMTSAFTLDSDGNYTFNPTSYQNLAQGEEENLTIPITVIDGTLTDEQNLTIIITGVDDPLVANAGTDVNATLGQTIDFDASGSFDLDNNVTSYQWSEDGTVLAADNISFSKGDFSVGEHNITLTITNDEGKTAEDMITVLITTMFTEHIVLQNMGTPEGTYVTDVDRDGFIDILTAGYGTDDNGWLRNEGNGSFSSTLGLVANSDSPESIFSIDLDRDGDMDIISGKDRNRWEWHANDGSQTFASTTINSGMSTNYIGATDFDKDGDIDIYYGSWNTGSLAWSENDGSQNFTEHVIATSANSVGTVQPVDLDNDGDLDFVAALIDSGTIAWYENQDDNLTFNERVLDSNATKIFSVSIADINQDGYQDIVAGPDLNGKVHCFTNNKDKTFTQTTNRESEWSTLATKFGTSATGDIDNDGDIDILYTSYDKGEFGWYTNDGFGNFSDKQVITKVAGIQPLDIYLADLDNDGDLDFTLALVGTKEYAWYENHLLSGDEVQILPKTGQITSYSIGDDGDNQKGLANDFSRNDLTKIVKDSSTGLMWQDNAEASGKTMTWMDAMNYCEDSILGGFNDWRLPEIQTLYHLAKKDSTPVLDTTHFTNIDASETGYWSSDLNPANDIATFVKFTNATENYVYTKDIILFGTLITPEPTKNVRCVRGNQPKLNLTRDEITSMVTDHKHALSWHDGDESNTTSATWEGALDYCAELGSEWRLPNIHELYSIVDPAKTYPAFESSFVYTSNEKFWSSTTDKKSDNNVERRYLIDFSTGHDEGEDNSSQPHNVRCVKDIP